MIAFLIAGYTSARHCHEARNVFFLRRRERAAAGEPAARGKEAGEDGAEGSGREETKEAGREEAKVWERESLRRENCHSYVYAVVFCAIIVFAEFPPSEEL